jgi:homoaconitase/3-isopropylmalate dehydratase large subunit
LNVQTLKSDEGAHFDRIVKISSADISPTVSWGTSPQDVVSISGNVPSPADATSEAQKTGIERALAYMGLTAGMKMEDVKIEKVSYSVILIPCLTQLTSQ